MNVLTTALKNVWRRRDRYLPFAAISLAGAFLIVSAITLLGSTRTLTDMLTLPYMGFYKLVPTDTEDTDPVDMSVMSGLTEEFLLAHEAVEEIRLSKTYQKNLPLADNYADMYVNAVIAQNFF